MKSPEIKTLALSMGMLVFLSGCSVKKPDNISNNTAITNNTSNPNESGSQISSSNEQSPGSVKIKYNLSYIRKLASNQVAVWIEDSNGNYIRSIYASNYTASGGYKQRSEALTEWIKKSKWENASKSEIDTVSSATQSPGNITLIWDCKDTKGSAVKPGKYVYKIEGNIYWGSRVLYSGEIEVGNSENDSTAKANYINKDSKNNDTLIKNVSAEYTPKK
ncbi:hypothetical protein CPAST_c23730 [Clostridium pasteurianum DSM 525 = ATCC 6013]|uniref:Putative conserved protein UCP014995 n=1 Tax=Clostridium pasteurianum DSM 525 = ATCC 6013 TaxID=1262449 RepID=A0A0H3J8X7_CLOPA|nr:DUF2271 domain-containing protein [Clostridium pasteurianum]AJA48443.1 hypothetical protein CPAST_c23730 [Clostridium pasteurianum DSM 525 = ATCC 6013]AJA52431.1 hypothetical protein CLPA_c23730 [Clostridium pasteurianum DSM 525 = ATCC 6013]AOZ75687.1 hypothetical protein AQ983_11540 [Clostridium pasteurianum DSM 525 = ATCC 6013]AOZ79483.1 hypothetical protein AQ984_11535 [Clostridium pasteurianum]ELP60407.1 hypothetical protein F502_02942 [Clostridium pasteurianum DSM 525 = ATCC 6013]